MLNMQNNISNFLLLIDIGQASCLYLLCHLFILLIIHPPIIYWIFMLYETL